MKIFFKVLFDSLLKLVFKLMLTRLRSKPIKMRLIFGSANEMARKQQSENWPYIEAFRNEIDD